MCMMCEGATLDEYLESLHDQIMQRGFAIAGVKDAHGPQWAYTIGLVDGFGHPELVAVHEDVNRAAWVVAMLANRIVDGERLRAGDEVRVDDDDGPSVGLRSVATPQIDNGLMSSWVEYYDAACRWDLELTALQVVLPDARYCYEHQQTQPRLDLGTHPLGNRAARRAAARHRRRPPRQKRRSSGAPRKRKR